ncbi:HlyD family efflux transporter periplasmic adaptor subunit [Muricauda sp. SCSIO 64092]|uniref:HlyD family secretion protein n=1 Tax=Allomuricauda sp. SCSIO 64092 TaxID=2908842 RepID=UPI001FF35289|nr:HlyD family efflux transporter periplasmic adaptor subunit [Muricauda sp. SCSIO 64092]UOY08354.1 HlyD family efflux transporter periplasmic adaptor subunit [Muricauda sp. SCSIO 64092]
MKSYFPIALLLLGLMSCNDNGKADAYGNFEATTVMVSAKGSGELLKFDIKEGQQVAASAVVGLIDTVQLHLERLKLKAQLNALDLKVQEAAPEVAVLLEDRSNLIRERDRTLRLFEQKAATQQQLDDYNGRVDLIDQRIRTTQRNIGIANRAILSERKPLEAQIALIDQQIRDHTVINPISGTILTKFAEEHELVGHGTPLFKVANLDDIKLKAYTSATLLQNVVLGDEVRVRIDKGEDDYRELIGSVTWIADEAEFTPKTIETKEERVNLVYGLEVTVVNDGTLKIGMPGEVLFNPAPEE